MGTRCQSIYFRDPDRHLLELSNARLVGDLLKAIKDEGRECRMFRLHVYACALRDILFHSCLRFDVFAPARRSRGNLE
jgi:hypothetical protein